MNNNDAMESLKVLLVHNHYGGYSGETAVMEAQELLLEQHGHDVLSYTRSSVELETMPFGKARAFFSGLYNPYSIHKIHRLLQEFCPDVVHVHNLYPLISPAVLTIFRKAGIPVVMTVHNYRLVCPSGLFYNSNGICERCTRGKEWNCVRFNCERSLTKSTGYALRNVWSRMAGYYRNNVDAFLCLTEFQKLKLVENGFAEERCFVLPNFFQGKYCHDYEKKNSGSYVAFAGRISREKGVGLLFDVARELPAIPFRLAGSVSDETLIEGKPDNVEFVGMLKGDRFHAFYEDAALFLLSSVWYEGFPMVILEAMNHGLPIVAPRLGGLPEIVDDGICGSLYEAGDRNDLVKKLDEIWNDRAKLHAMSRSAHSKLGKCYLADSYYESLVAIYRMLR